jgi:Fic family protein
MRTYIESHPWITFEFDTKRFHASLWILLGEAQSKCAHISGVPLRPDTQKDLNTMYLVKGVQATTAIEGNTLSEEEVRLRVEGKGELPPSKEYLGQEVDNVIEACNGIMKELIEKTSLPLSPEAIKRFNKLVLKDLEVDDEVIPGEFRQHKVGIPIARYSGAPVEDCEFLTDKLCQWMNSLTPNDLQNGILYGLLRAIITHLYLAWIHPFGDGNGRTARLIEFQILLEAGVPFSSAHVLSNHYNQTRTEYYRQLDQASKSGGDVVPFIRYAVQGFVDGLADQINTIREQQLDVAWRNHVHESFKDKNSKVQMRRRRLVLDLPDETVPLSQITEISPRVAASYTSKTARRILLRDLEELIRMDLIDLNDEGLFANKVQMLAFLPTALPSETQSE